MFGRLLTVPYLTSPSKDASSHGSTVPLPACLQYLGKLGKLGYASTVLAYLSCCLFLPDPGLVCMSPTSYVQEELWAGESYLRYYM